MSNGALAWEAEQAQTERDRQTETDRERQTERKRDRQRERVRPLPPQKKRLTIFDGSSAALQALVPAVVPSVGAGLAGRLGPPRPGVLTGGEGRDWGRTGKRSAVNH